MYFVEFLQRILSLQYGRIYIFYRASHCSEFCVYYENLLLIINNHKNRNLWLNPKCPELEKESASPRYRPTRAFGSSLLKVPNPDCTPLPVRLPIGISRTFISTTVSRVKENEC